MLNLLTPTSIHYSMLSERDKYERGERDSIMLYLLDYGLCPLHVNCAKICVRVIILKAVSEHLLEAASSSFFFNLI